MIKPTATWLCLLLTVVSCGKPPVWAPHESAVIASLNLDALPQLPADPSNRVVGDANAIAFGQALFNDTRLSANGKVACATCHHPENFFADTTPRSRGIGPTQRHTPGLLGVAYNRWYYWDGRRDSLWSQALTPLEHPNEHGLSRREVVNLIASDPGFLRQYQAVFAAEPTDKDVDQVFANVGKAIAAFESTLMPQAAAFDRYARHITQSPGKTATPPDFGPQQILGLQLFIGKGQCVTCHNGPLFTNQAFHNIGTGNSLHGDPDDPGRWAGVREVLSNPFNCLSPHSDAEPDSCAVNFAKTQGSELRGAFKVPGLRNVAATPPYMHDGRFATLAEVVQHYVVAAPSPMGHSEIIPLNLSPAEQDALISFLASLTQPP